MQFKGIDGRRAAAYAHYGNGLRQGQYTCERRCARLAEIAKPAVFLASDE